MVTMRPGRLMNDAALGVLLLLLGGITARICFTGDYRNYVKPGLLPLLAIAAAALLAIGAVTLRHEFAPPRAARHAHSTDRTVDATAHDHAHAPAIGWLLLVPVLTLALLAPAALGADAANRAGTALTEPVDGLPPLPDGDPVQLSLRDYASRAVFDADSLGNRQVQLVGFVTITDDGRPQLTRLALACCAADARPIKVGMTGEVPPELTADTWLRVTGRYTSTHDRDAVNGATIPYVEVQTAEIIARPSDPYTT
jgi:uncharacterized repeat protein (TIGR03943 family)